MSPPRTTAVADPGTVRVTEVFVVPRRARTTTVRVSCRASASAYCQLTVIDGEVGVPSPTPGIVLRCTGVAGTNVLVRISGVGGLHPKNPSRETGAHDRTVTRQRPV